MGKGFRCFRYALIGVALILVGATAAFAHTWPTTSTATGVTISLTAFRSCDGLTPTLDGLGNPVPVLPGTVNQCETIIYRATLSYAGGANAAIFGGTLTITPPTGPPVNVTPDAPGIPCLGPSDQAEINEEDCFGTLSVDSKLLPYTIDVATCPATVTASVDYTGGTSHIGDSNTPGNAASTSFPLTVVCCAQDNTVCNGTEFCDPAVAFTDPNTGFCRLGTCADGPDLNCDDNDVCTADVCDPVTGCASTPIVCDDNSVCTTDACVPGTGCVFTPISCDDNDVCTTDVCDPVSGCAHTAISCDDNDVCTTDTCDPVSGCGNVAISCDDNNPCTVDTCDPVNGCVHTFDPTIPGCVNEEICRTPGFWATHGGIEKSSSTNITLALLNAYNTANPGNPLNVCGTDITNTDCGSNQSALEAMCVSPKGDSRLQLGRQLTAAALNCIITKSGDGDICTSLAGDVCSGVSIGAIWDACNAACPTGTTADVDLDNDPLTPDVTVSCIGAIDCFNNGGVIDPTDGSCDNALGETCHDRDLDNGCFDFEPPGAAGSPKECNDSRKNAVTIFTASGACNP